jgi:hypothetical protein
MKIVKHQFEKCFRVTDLMQMEKRTEMAVLSNAVNGIPSSVQSVSVNL